MNSSSSAMEAVRQQLSMPSALVAKSARNAASAANKPTDAKNAETEAQRLKQAGADMEALFLTQLLKQMRATVPKSDLFGKSMATDLFKSMLDAKMAEVLAQRGTLGLGQMVTHQLAPSVDNSEAQETPSNKIIKEYRRSNR